jgi:hypothetical protein
MYQYKLQIKWDCKKLSCHFDESFPVLTFLTNQHDYSMKFYKDDGDGGNINSECRQ